MPQCCVVPLCSTRKSGHRFPKNPTLRKAWLIAIRRDKFVPTEHSRVCYKHFTEADFALPKDSLVDNPKPRLKAGATPSVFSWSGDNSIPSDRAERLKRRGSVKKLAQRQLIQPEEEIDDIEPDLVCTDQPSSPAMDHETDSVTEDDLLNFQSEETVADSCADISGSYEENSDEGNNDTNACMSDVETETTNNDFGGRAMRIVNFRDDRAKEQLKFYTGFDSYEHFMFVFNLLGPAANDLNYYSEYSVKGGSGVKTLLPEDQFFLTMIKLRRYKLNKELGYMFGVSQEVVARVVITWINFLYCQFKEIDIWVPHSTFTNLVKDSNHATTIIDCTEIKIAKPKNPTEQQQTYSSYKGCNTMKVLVGISPTGAVTFVSDAYGGSISDRALVEKSGFIDKLKPKDVILADRGFNIQDLLCHKDVTMNIPDFVPAGKGQLKPEQLARSKKISSKRIHVERIIGLAKTYNIMKGPLLCSLVPLTSRIVFVCFMLANFRANIVM